MRKFYELFYVNVNTLPTFPTVIMIFYFCIIIFMFLFLFHKIKVLKYAAYIEGIMFIYMLDYLLLVNADTLEEVIILTKIFYILMSILASCTALSAYFITSTNRKLRSKIFAMFNIGLSCIIIFIVIASRSLIITEEIIVGSYLMAGKGPLYFLVIFQAMQLAIYLFVDLGIRYIEREETIRDYGMFYLAMVIYTVNMGIVGIKIQGDQYYKPNLYISAMGFSAILVVYTFKEIKKNVNQTTELNQAYLFDGLTGIYNRSYIIELLDQIVRSDYYESLFVAVIDIDRFKQVNDSLGHIVGDKVLKELGYLLRDIAGNNAKTGRIGGDEFLFFIQDEKNEKVKRTLEKLLVDFNDKLKELGIDNDNMKCGLSIGVVNVKGNNNIKYIFNKADENMYISKKNGKNRIEFSN